MTKITCPNCDGKKVYKMSTGRRRCAQCKYDFFPHALPLRLTMGEWREIIHLFLMEQSSNSIVEQTNLEKKRVFRALLKIRMVLAKEIPDIFSGTVEVDETYLGGAWKNKRKVVRDTGNKRGRGTSKQPVFGILCRNGHVWAKIVQNVDETTLLPLITKKVEPGSTVCSDTWEAYTGIAARGYFHRLINHGEGKYSDGKGNHINGMEGFCGYLKRKPASKGGVTRSGLPLYIAEYVW